MYIARLTNPALKSRMITLVRVTQKRRISNHAHISNVQRRSLPGEHGIVPAKWLKSGRGQQLGRPAVECLCDLQEIQHGDITLAPFDLAHVASVNLSNVSQGFLRDIEILPASANGASDRLQVFLSVALAATV
jgi:hypothetical protein